MNIKTLDDLSRPNANGYRRANNQNNSQNNQPNNAGLFSPTLYKMKTFSFGILIVNAIIYLIEVFFYYIYYHKEKNFTCILYNMGAQSTPAIVHNFQIWRFITPVFLHASLLHIIMNSISIGFISFYIEKNIGIKKLIMLYFLSGIYGNMFSSVMMSESIGVGASGAIMGMSGLLLMLLYLTYHKMRPNEKTFFIYFAIMTFVNIAYTGVGKDGNKVDNHAHLGGFVFGAFSSIFFLNDKIDLGRFSVYLIKKIKIVSTLVISLVPAICALYIFFSKIPDNIMKAAC